MPKKIVLFLLCTVLLCSLCACAGQKKESKENLPFSYQCVTLFSLPDAEQSYQNEYYFFQNVEDLEKAKQTLAAQFDINKTVEGETKTLNDALSAYDEDFFKHKTLLFLKRFHSTDAKLKLNSIDLKEGDFLLHADLETGKAPSSLFRAYFVELDKASYIRNEAKIKTDIHEIEAPKDEVYEKHLVIAFGKQYKVILDDALAEKIKTDISTAKFEPTDFDPDTHIADPGDIVIFGPDCYATFNKDYIGVGLSAYAPDEKIQSELLKFYVSLESPEKTANFSEETDNLTEKP